MSTFVAVAASGSFSRAAEVLTLPNARVSQRIADLERHLGVRLLQRTTRALHLTEEGKLYLAKCQQVLQQISDVEAMLKGGLETPNGVVRVDALTSISRWLIAPHLHLFQKQFPEVSVRLGSSDHMRNLLDDSIDCAIRSGSLKSSTHIAQHICDVQLGLYAAPAYLARHDSITHPHALKTLHCISWFSGVRNPFPWRLHHEQSTVELEPREALSFDDPDVALAACVAGSGICPSAPFAAEYWVRSGALVPVLPQWSFDIRPIHIVYTSNKQLPSRVRAFVDWIVDLMRTNPSVSMTPLELASLPEMAQIANSRSRE